MCRQPFWGVWQSIVPPSARALAGVSSSTHYDNSNSFPITLEFVPSRSMPSTKRQDHFTSRRLCFLTGRSSSSGISRCISYENWTFRPHSEKLVRVAQPPTAVPFAAGKDRTVVSYQAGSECVADIEPLAVGDELRDMALFLAGDLHVMTPLEATYQAAWAASPEALRVAVETGVVPDPDAD